MNNQFFSVILIRRRHKYIFQSDVLHCEKEFVLRSDDEIQLRQLRKKRIPKIISVRWRTVRSVRSSGCHVVPFPAFCVEIFVKLNGAFSFRPKSAFV